MTTTTTCTATKQPLLTMEAALASRIIQSATFPRELFQWLSGREDFKACDSSLATPGLTASMNEILAPMLADARQRELKETRHAARWLAAICRSTADHYERLDLGIGPRILAAAFLPLYRSLATSHLSEGLRESRLRLSETLTLLALCDEVGDDLVQLLDPQNRAIESPTTVLSKQFDIDLTCLAQVVREQLANFDTIQRQFNADGIEELTRLERKQARSKTTEWAAPDLLWKLAGELISQNSELVLPRTWIETPVPWNSIADHWNKLSLLLNGKAAGQSKPHETDATTANGRTAATKARNKITSFSQSDEAITLATIDELTSMINPKTPTQPVSATARPMPIALGETHVDVDADEMAANQTASEILGHDHSAMTQPNMAPTNEPTDHLHRAPTVSAVAPVVIPKVLIAEVRTHNDPVFVKVISRQIAKCRAEERAISLVSMIVQPEDSNDHHDIRENGLALWQQRLVNWLADHPQVIEPHAFLTCEGELLLCLLDLERNETTTLVRNGLVEVLTGRRVDETDGSVLAKVNVPARYHAGIASTSAPGSGFTAEQLIEPAVRCLSAASRHGKASIKSIEVF